MTAAVRPDLVTHTARFCRLLRESGLPATPGDTVDAARVLGLVDLTDREELRLALRSVLVNRVEDGRVFDELFDVFWGGGRRVEALDRLQRRNPTPTPPKREKAPLSLDQWLKGGDDDERKEEASLPSPSALESLGRQDFRTFGDDALRDVTRVARHIARRLATRPSRRW